MAGQFDNVFNELMAGAMAPIDAKRAEISVAAQNKRAALDGTPTFADRYEQAYRDSLNSGDFARPESAIDMLNRGDLTGMLQDSTASAEFRADASARRSDGEVIMDTGKDVLGGFAGGLANIGAMGIGLFDDESGAEAARAVDRMFQSLRETQSTALNRRREAHAAKNAVTSKLNASKQKRDLNYDSDVVAGLKKIGRNAIDSMGHAWEDGAILGSGVSSGVGSLFAGGAIGKGLKAAGMARGAMPTAIGLLEGGAAFTGTAAEIMAMDHDTLMANSPDYVALLEQGFDPLDAKRELANHAGMGAGAAQGVVGALTGKLVSKFEANPLAVPSVRTAAGNVLREGVEEGIQSGSGEAVQNVAIQQTADQNREIGQGVGEAIGEGALYGMGTAGVLQTPGALGQAGIAAIKAPLRAGAEAWGNILARADKVRSEAEAAGPMSAQNIEARVTEVEAASTPEVQAEMETAIAENAASPEQAEQQLNYTRTLFDKIKATPAVTENANPTIAAALDGVQSPFKALQQVATIASDENASEQDRLDAGLYIIDSIQQNEDLFDSDLRNAIEEIPDDHPALPYLRAMEQVLLDVQEHPAIQNAIKSALAYKQSASNPEHVAAVAIRNPEAIDPDVADEVLFQMKGKNRLTAFQQTAIKNAAGLVRAAREKQARIADLDLKVNKVSSQIKIDMGEDTYTSAADHMKRVQTAVRLGKLEEAKELLTRFQNFAIHMQNKVQALNEHLNLGTGNESDAVPYVALRAGTIDQWYEDKKGLWVNPNAANTVRNAQRINLDAKAVSQISNLMTAAFPELGLKPLPEVNLDPRLDGKPEEVKQRWKAAQGSQKASNQPTPNQDSQQAAAEPVEASQPVVETDTKTEKQKTAQPDQKAEPKAADESSKSSPEEVRSEPEQVTEEEVPELTVESYVDDYIAGKGRNSPIHEQFAINNAEAIDAEFKRRKKEADEKAKSTETETVEPAEPKTGEQAGTARNPAGTIDPVKQAQERFETDILSVEEKDLAHLTDDQVLEVFQAQTGHHVTTLPNRAKTVVRTVLNHIKRRTGVNLASLPRFIKQSDTLDEGQGGIYVSQANMVVIASSMMADSDEAIAHVFAHELAHAIDVAAASVGQYNASLGDLTDVMNDEDLTTTGSTVWAKHGEIYKEFMSLSDELFDNIGSTLPLKAYVSDQSAAQISQELFAEIGRIVLLHPEIAEEVMPNGTREFRKIFDQAVKNSGIQKSEPNVDNTSTEENSEEVTERDLKTVKGAFPKLISIEAKGIRNRFLSSFVMPKTARSRLIGLGNAGRAVFEALSSPAAFKAMAGKLSHKLTPDVIKAYRAYLKHGDAVTQRMAKRLNDALDKKLSNGRTLRDNLLNGDFRRKDGTVVPVNTLVDYRVLNLLDREGDDLGYNLELAHGAMLAGLQWTLLHADPKRYLDEEEVAEILGIDESEVTDDMLKFFTEGSSLVEATRSLGAMIARYWGLNGNPKAPEGYVKGITEGMAKEVLVALEEQGLIERREAKFGEKDYIGFKKAKVPQLEKLSEFPSAIEELIVVDPVGINYIGSPPPVNTEASGPFTELTEQQIDAKRHQETTPYFMNTPLVELFLNNGIDVVMKLFGDAIPSNITSAYRKSLEGSNRTVAAAFEQMQSLITEIRSVAAEAGTEADQTPVYYPHEFSRVNRLHMQGAHNPQANKFMRELMLSTRSTLDLLNPNGKDYQSFMLAIAQHLGVKVEQKPRAQSVKEAQALLDSQLAESVKILQHVLKTGRKFTEADIATLQSEFGNDLSPGAFHAVAEYARLRNSKTSEAEAFTTSLYLEADGKTDGPINALMHLATGEFTPRWLQLMAKGGLFVGTGIRTLAQHITNDAVDLYKETTNDLTTRLKQFHAANRGKPGMNDQMNAMWTLLNEFFGKDFRIEDGKLIIDRGLAKNPLTVTIYGSGAKGIANKITGELVREFYRRASTDVTDGISPEATQALKLLFTKVAVDTKKKGWMVIPQRDVEGAKWTKNDGIDDVTLSRSQIRNLTDNVKNLLVANLSESIDSVIGEVNQGKNALRQAVQVQSIFLQYAFQQKIAEKLAEKAKADPNFKQDEFLSREELTALYEDLKKLAPVITTGTQIFFPAASQKTEVQGNGKRNPEFSRTLDGKLSTQAWVDGPVNAGVRGIPFMIIGPGDGQMMQNVASMDNAPQGVMLVFDGMNMKLSTIDEDSVKVNQAVYDAWMQGNPLEAVSKSFTEFMKQADTDPSQMPEEMVKDLLDALVDPRIREDVEPDNLPGYMSELEQQIARLARMNAARKRVLAQVNLAVDHMASAESPFEVSDKITLTGTPEEVVARLNQMLWEELGLVDAQTEAENTETSGIQVLTMQNVFNVLRGRKTGVAQQQVINELTKALKDSTYKIVAGSVEQLRAYATQNGETLPNEFGDPSFEIGGYISPSSQTIFLVNNDPTFTVSAETMIHELLHAATYGKVSLFYSNPSALSQIERDAMERIDILFQQWMLLDEEEGNGAYLDAYNAAQLQIVKGNKAGAVNEFMAWTLSNPDLIKQAKTVKARPLARIAARALAVINDLIWGKTSAPKVGGDLFSNLRFNTSILLNFGTIEQRMDGVGLFHSRQFGTNDRLSQLRDSFFHKMKRLELNVANAVLRSAETSKINLALAQADAVAQSFHNNGFRMTPQELSTFQMMVAAFATEAFLDPNALVRVEDIYAHVAKNLKVDDFIKPGVTRYWAQKRFDLVMGNYTVIRDAQGRTSLMSAFLALAATNDDFRDVLSRMDVPKSVKNEGKSVDDVLENFGTDLMDKLTLALSGEGKAANSQEALDALTIKLSNSIENDENFIVQQVSRLGNFADKVNEVIIDSAGTLANSGIQKLNELQARFNNKYATAATELGKVVLSMANEDRADEVSKGVLEMINRTKLVKPLHDFVVELVGRTSDNKTIYDMIKLVRSTVQQLRQQFREHLPETIASKFSRKLTDEEWSHLMKGLAKTDLAALHDSKTTAQIMRILKDPARIATEIGAYEQRIEQMDPENWTLLQKKMKELAEYMNTGKPSDSLLRNANAIANLLNEVPSRNRSKNVAITQDFINAIDQLTTLYAVDGLEQSVKDSVISLAQTEEEGMAFAYSYLVGQRKDEAAKANRTGRAEFNHYKGFIPTENEHGVSLIVADDREFGRLKLLGYERVGNYEGSRAEHQGRRKGYYFAPLSGRAQYNQGIIQNVRETAYGIDPLTGYSVGVMTAGRITDPQLVQYIRRARRYNATATEPLMPIFDRDGAVVAYERSVDPNQHSRLNPTDNLATAIGIWRGRQAEEATAQSVNSALITGLHDMWDREKGTQRDSYVNVFDPREQAKDKVLADAISLMTPQTRNRIESLFEEDEFWVRRDLLNNALGYRSASVGDIWTGNTRIDPKITKMAQNVATGVFGANAYKWAVTGEKFWQNFIQDARMTIVVKSVVVPAANLLSNIVQLAARGVPIKDIVSGIPKKTAEVNAYVKGRLKKIELEAELRAAENDLIKSTRLKREITSINDGFKRMSIWPLIEAGEFASISDAGITQDEILLSEGRLNAYMEKLTDKLPEGVKNLGRYALISRDTALFKGLQRAVEYGDFLGKAILFDDLTKRQKKDKAYALGRITEEFVNYDFLAGRSRTYLENMGLMWFWNFKVRSVKIALSTIRNNPVHLLLSSLVPVPDLIGSIGSPMTDNLFSVAYDGRLDYSVGPGQAYHAHMLNPWWNLWN